MSSGYWRDLWEYTKARSVGYWVVLALIAVLVPGWIIWPVVIVLIGYGLSNRRR